jgi:exosortase
VRATIEKDQAEVSVPTGVSAKTSSSNLREKLPLLLLGLVLLLTYIPVIIDLVKDWWQDPNYSHGFLVPFVSIYLVYKKWPELAISEKKSCWWGLALLVFGLLLLILGTAGAEYFTVRFSLVVVLAGLVAYLYGKKFLGLLLVPICYLLFMIPIPYTIYYSLTLPMQLFASKCAVGVLQFLGIPVFRAGNIIILPNYSLEVGEACSGLRSLVSLMALGFLFAYLSQKRNLNRAILFASTPIIAIIANVFRVSTTALGAYAVSPKLAEDFLHKLSGLLVFVCSVFCLVILGGILSWVQKRKES